MSKKNPRQRFTERLAVLNRRADFLKTRISTYQGSDASRDKHELSALTWAIHIIEEYPREAMNIIQFYEKSAEEANPSGTE